LPVPAVSLPAFGVQRCRFATMWWAVSIDNQPFGQLTFENDQPSAFHLMDLVELDGRIRSASFTCGFGSFTGFRCSVDAVNADAALEIACRAYQAAVGEAMNGPVDSLVCIEGDLMSGDEGKDLERRGR